MEYSDREDKEDISENGSRFSDKCSIIFIFHLFIFPGERLNHLCRQLDVGPNHDSIMISLSSQSTMLPSHYLII